MVSIFGLSALSFLCGCSALNHRSVVATRNLAPFSSSPLPSHDKSLPSSVNSRLSSRLHGYVRPELDPEFSKQAVPSYNALSDLNATLPIPKEGDIVRCSASWGVGGKNWEDNRLGRIRFLRYNPDKDCWVADISPLQEGKADKVFSIDRNAKSFFESVDTLQPVQAFFMRSENGYKVAMKKNSTEVILKAAGYRPLDQTYVPPSIKVLTFLAYFVCTKSHKIAYF